MPNLLTTRPLRTSFVMCGTMGYLFHVWGSVSVGLFFLVISICTVFLFWEGNWNNLQLNNCFGGPEKGLAGQRPALAGWLLRRLLLLLRWC